jgi:hypothetical protein
MIIKQTLLLFACIVTVGFGTVASLSAPVSATDCGKDASGNPIKTSIIGGDICKGVDNSSSDPQKNAIWSLLIFVLNIMTAGVGILAVGGIVYGSILYASAADKAEQTKKAISIITNVVIGVVAFGLMYLLLNFIIPGGVFN